MKRFALLCFFCFLFLGCKSTPKADGNLLNGMIYDEENEPVANVVISVNDESITSSDVNGHFLLKKSFAEKNIKILCSKKDYETVIFECELLTVPQVVYIKMYSFNQLLALAEKDLLDSKFEEAETTLERAEHVKPNQITTQFLKAVCLYKQGDSEKALSILEGLDQDNKYIDLFKKDIRLDKNLLKMP